MPVGYTEDIFEALDIQDELQTLYTSGTVFHAFLGERLPDWQTTAKLVKAISDNYRLPYYTISPTYSVCSEHGYITGEHFSCPHCGKPAEVYSRITGYYRPVQNWNDGKAQEYKHRKEYKPDLDKCETLEKNNTQYEETKINNETTGELLLVTTRTCPNCSIVKNTLKSKNIEYKEVLAEENSELCKEQKIMSVPTLLVKTNEGYEKYTNASNIIKYINSL